MDHTLTVNPVWGDNRCAWWTPQTTNVCFIYIPQYLFIFNTCTYLHAITVDTQIPESSLTAYSFLCYYTKSAFFSCVRSDTSPISVRLLCIALNQLNFLSRIFGKSFCRQSSETRGSVLCACGVVWINVVTYAYIIYALLFAFWFFNGDTPQCSRPWSSTWKLLLTFSDSACLPSPTCRLN